MDSPKYISLFSGIGGLDLGFQMAFRSVKPACYVERDALSIEILLSRMDDYLSPSPIWSDVNTFDASVFRGITAIVGGFPCQPVSKSGRNFGVADSRWLWPQFERIIGECNPDFVFIENVKGLLWSNRGKAFQQVVEGLASYRYDAIWSIFKARDVGASQERDRIFILAYSRHNSERTKQWLKCNISPSQPQSLWNIPGLPTWAPPMSDLTTWNRISTIPGVPSPVSKPPILRVVDGTSKELYEYRLKTIGNAVVPAQACFAIQQLVGQL